MEYTFCSVISSKFSVIARFSIYTLRKSFLLTKKQPAHSEMTGSHDLHTAQLMVRTKCCIFYYLAAEFQECLAGILCLPSPNLAMACLAPHSRLVVVCALFVPLAMGSVKWCFN